MPDIEEAPARPKGEAVLLFLGLAAVTGGVPECDRELTSWLGLVANDAPLQLPEQVAAISGAGLLLTPSPGRANGAL